jgi:acyl carrier protein
MGTNEIKDRVIEIASGVFSVPESEISEDSTAGEVENWDSLGNLNLFLALEGELAVKFTAEEIMSLNSIGAIVGRIMEKQESGG